MEWALLGAALDAGAFLVFLAVLNHPGRQAEEDLEAREIAAMQAAKMVKMLRSVS